MKLTFEEILNVVMVIPLRTKKKGTPDEARYVLRIHPGRFLVGLLGLIVVAVAVAALALDGILRGPGGLDMMNVVLVASFLIGVLAVVQINLDL